MRVPQELDLTLLMAEQQAVTVFQMATLVTIRRILADADQCKSLYELVLKLQAAEKELRPDVVPTMRLDPKL